MSEQKNLILAILLSLTVLIGYQQIVIEPQLEEQRLYEESLAQQAAEDMPQATMPDASSDANLGDAPVPSGDVPTPTVNNAGQAAPSEIQQSASTMAPSPRIAVETPSLTGSIALRGARFDDLSLSKYQISLDDPSSVHLLQDSAAADGYFAEYGWTAREGAGVLLPGADTLWTASSDTLRPGAPVTLSWANGQGLMFERVISVDEDYAFTVHSTVRNTGEVDILLAPYALVARKGTPKTDGFVILHEGPIGVLGGELQEIDYGDLREDGASQFNSTGGWLGITDKYWQVIMVPDQTLPMTARFFHRLQNGRDRYQVDYLHSEVRVPAGGSVEMTSHLVAGAKEIAVIDRYEEQFQAALFDRTIDWGWLYFLTKPIFLALQFLHGIVGNLGIAILLLTVVVKLFFFPLANKQYIAMSKMKKLQPKMTKLRERYSDDKMKMQQELMALYQKEQVNPWAGCLPILLQIPVFFALYKTLYISIEMRHQPFYGWIHDLSARDPMTPLNLFGMIPWDPPSILAVGVWPILMGLTMWFQMRLNPQQADPVQAKIFAIMPIFFTFIMAPFAAGLVIYWTWNNILSIAQQWYIMRKMGVSVNED